MRYTTIIDISASQTLYKNHNVRLVYLHLVLTSGYHDNDRDLCNTSLRNLANDVGLTLSATRHAIKQLEAAKMISRKDSLIWVRKFVMEQPISKRGTTKAQQSLIDAAAARKRAEAQRERQLEIDKALRTQEEAQGKDSFMVYYESMEAKAKAGDAEAQRVVERRRQQYEQHKESIKNNKNEETK